MIDDGFIVADALPLSEAWAELRGLFELGGLSPGDRRHPAFAFYSSLPVSGLNDAVREDWIARVVLATLAEEVLKKSIATGQILVWTADQNGERARDPRVLFAPSECDWHKTFATGRYIPVQGQPIKPPSYVRARLWLKLAAWAEARSSLVKHRGAEGALALEIVSALSSSRDLVEDSGGVAERSVEKPWSEAEMLKAIADCSLTNRERAWKEHFEPRQREHGWTNSDFRNVWSKGRGTTGMVGRPLK